MKFLVIFGIVALVAGSWALTDEQKAQAENYATECLSSEGVTAEEAKKIKSGDFNDASDNAKCFANCVLEKSSLVKDGVLQEEQAIAVLSKTSNAEKAKQVVDICKNVKGANNCETGFKITECYAQNKPILTI